VQRELPVCVAKRLGTGSVLRPRRILLRRAPVVHGALRAETHIGLSWKLVVRDGNASHMKVRTTDDSYGTHLPFIVKWRTKQKKNTDDHHAQACRMPPGRFVFGRSWSWAGLGHLGSIYNKRCEGDKRIVCYRTHKIKNTTTTILSKTTSTTPNNNHEVFFHSFRFRSQQQHHVCLSDHCGNDGAQHEPSWFNRHCGYQQ